MLTEESVLAAEKLAEEVAAAEEQAAERGAEELGGEEESDGVFMSDSEDRAGY